MNKPLNIHLAIFREFLKKFIVFNDKEWAIFSEQLYAKTLQRKEHFIQSGKISDEAGFIIEGAVRCYNIKNGDEITGYFCLENELISAYKSFLTSTPTTTSIQALEKTTLILFNRDGLNSLLANEQINLKIERFGRLVAEYYLICYDDRVTSFVTQSAEERYVQLLKDNRNIVERIPQHYIANFLGITPVSLSRIRKRITVPTSPNITSVLS